MKGPQCVAWLRARACSRVRTSSPTSAAVFASGTVEMTTGARNSPLRVATPATRRRSSTRMPRARVAKRTLPPLRRTTSRKSSARPRRPPCTYWAPRR